MKPQFVYITAKDAEQAKAIGKVLVEERLAACANILPGMSSFYWWKGHVTEDHEAVLIVKTLADKFDALKERVKALHTYKVPCVVALDINDGLSDYLAWIKSETKG